MPGMLPTRNNLAIANAVEAVARAHIRYPGVTPDKVLQVANAIEAVCKGQQTAVCIVAVCVELLRMIGAKDRINLERFRAPS